MSRLALARRELASLRDEKTIVLAVLIQLFIAAFSSFLVVGLVALYDPGAGGSAVTVDVGVTGNASESLAPVVDDGRTREAVVYENRSAARADFRAGRLDAVLEATAHPSGNASVVATVPEGDVRTTLVVVQLKDALAAYERQRRASLADRLVREPLALPPETERGGNPYYGFTYTVLVPLLVFLPVFISGSIAADSLTEELERGTLELLRVTPLDPAAIVDGKALAAAVLVPVQAGAWLALLAANGTPVAAPVALLVLVSALGVVAVSLAVALALAVEERRSAQLLYSVGVLAAFAALTLLPENPANAVAKLAIGSATPATYGVVAATVAVAVLGYAALRVAAGRLPSMTE